MALARAITSRFNGPLREQSIYSDVCNYYASKKKVKKFSDCKNEKIRFFDVIFKKQIKLNFTPFSVVFFTEVFFTSPYLLEFKTRGYE